MGFCGIRTSKKLLYQSIKEVVVKKIVRFAKNVILYPVLLACKVGHKLGSGCEDRPLWPSEPIKTVTNA